MKALLNTVIVAIIAFSLTVTYVSLYSLKRDINEVEKITDEQMMEFGKWLITKSWREE